MLVQVGKKNRRWFDLGLFDFFFVCRLIKDEDVEVSGKMSRISPIVLTPKQKRKDPKNGTTNGQYTIIKMEKSVSKVPKGTFEGTSTRRKNTKVEVNGSTPKAPSTP
jgi:hypothetical protein